MVYKTIFLMIGLLNLLGFALVTFCDKTTQASANTNTNKSESTKTSYFSSDLKKVS